MCFQSTEGLGATGLAQRLRPPGRDSLAELPMVSFPKPRLKQAIGAKQDSTLVVNVHSPTGMAELEGHAHRLLAFHAH